jgi:phospholipid/cholesterol/gamma-HCH transport system substrate-binding protein
MAKREEEIKVGGMVVLAVVLFLTALVFVGGVNLFRKRRVTYTTYFKFAGGLEPGAFVRFGGLKVGTVQAAEIDPQDPTRIRVQLSVIPRTPVRTNSEARISTLGFLGENYVEVSPGTKDAARLAPGGEIPSAEIVQLADVFNNVNNITLNANKLVGNLDERITLLSKNADQLINNLNTLVGPDNRQHIQSAITNLDGLLAETRPRLRTSLGNIDTASAKLPATLDKANQTMTETKTLATNLNSTVEENRKELREALINLRTSLVQAQHLMGDMQDLLDNNRGNLDEALENIRVSSQNLKEFTDQVKRQPFSLIRVKTQKDREPPIGK